MPSLREEWHPCLTGWKAGKETWRSEKFSFYFFPLHIIYGKNFTTSLKVATWWLGLASSVADVLTYTGLARDSGAVSVHILLKWMLLTIPGRANDHSRWQTIRATAALGMRMSRPAERGNIQRDRNLHEKTEGRKELGGKSAPTLLTPEFP